MYITEKDFRNRKVNSRNYTFNNRRPNGPHTYGQI